MEPLQEVKLTENHPLYEHFIGKVWIINEVVSNDVVLGEYMRLYRIDEQSGKTHWAFAERDWVEVIKERG